MGGIAKGGRCGPPFLSALFYKAMINMGKGGSAQNWDDKVHQGHA
jgi:hypothetical protein